MKNFSGSHDRNRRLKVILEEGGEDADRFYKNAYG